jgi:predicted enzyme related to lactoylglutathione lyase
MEMTVNAINWFEIPVADFARAKQFYSAIFDFDMPDMMMGPAQMGFLLHEQGKGVGGAIIKVDGQTPSATGTLAYLACGNDLAVVLGRVEAAGGAILVPKTLIAEGMGYFAHFRDSEGNRVGLHSMH